MTMVILKTPAEAFIFQAFQAVIDFLMHKSGSRKGLYRGVEQLVARRAHNPKVVGSSPASATKKRATYCFDGMWLF